MTLYKVPIVHADVTEDWVADTLKTSLNKSGQNCSKVVVKRFKASEPLEFGLLSSVFQAVCDAYSDDTNPTEHRVFIKIMPQDEEHLDFFASASLDVTEIETYNVLLRDMIAFEKERLGDEAKLSGIVPRAYASQYLNEPGKPRAFFLMMGDLAPRFKMPDTNKGTRKSYLQFIYTHAWGR